MIVYKWCRTLIGVNDPDSDVLVYPNPPGPGARDKTPGPTTHQYHLELTPTSTTSFTVPSYRYTREEKIPRLLHTSEMFMLPEVFIPTLRGRGARDEAERLTTIPTTE